METVKLGALYPLLRSSKKVSDFYNGQGKR